MSPHLKTSLGTTVALTGKIVVAALIAVSTISCGGSNNADDDGTGNGSGSVDASLPDAPGDGGVRDASSDGPHDAAPIDATSDAAPADAAIDAAPPDAAIDAAPPDAAVFTEPDYDFLSETGLYSNIVNKTVDPDNVLFEPAYKLWSDGAEKQRWIYVPPGQTVDTSNMDHWQFPVGTKLWKEFHHVVGNNTLLLETRLTEKWGPDPGDIYQASFVWNANDTDAAYAQFGASNIKGTDHDAPAAGDCVRCHRGETSKVLAFQAVQLSHDGEMNLDDFAAAGYFSDMPAPGGYPVPGNATEAAAVGYLHANCGHCHNNSNPQVQASGCYSLPQLQLWVKTTDTMIFDTYAYLQLVDQDLSFWTNAARGNVDGYTQRIVRGDPAASAVYYRMGAREAGQAPPLDDGQQMPPRFTDVPDANGLAAVEAWILSL